MSSSGSLSSACTVSTNVVFSDTSTSSSLVNSGAALAFVDPGDPLPEGDHSLSPSSFLARIWTSYSMSVSRSLIVTDNSVVVPSVQSCSEALVFLYW